jgi:hypothetical protein
VIERAVVEGDVFAAAILMVRGAEVLCPLASVTAKVNVVDPGLAGVP